MDAASLLSDLTPAQRRAVETDASPVCILAGAGSGKTRVLTRRIAYRMATGTADAGHVLALTFTRRAAGELGDRLRALGVRERLTAGTFHGVAYSQLRRYWADRGEVAPQLLDRKTRLLARLVAGRTNVVGAPLADLASEIEWASARLVTPERYEAAADAAGRCPPVAPDAMATLFARYQTEKVRRRLADFDDLLARCAEALERDPAFAAAQRWRWRHLFVDEFQDVNPLQYRLLSAWLGGQCDVCVVGDPNQAVYGWNGADATLLTRLPERWPETEVIHLDDNHRCTPQVVAAAASVLGPAGRRLRSSRSAGPAAAVRAFASDTAEAHGVVAELRQCHASGRPWSDMAVLVRTNAQGAAFEVACRAARIPYRLAGARPLLDDPDVRVIVAAIGRRRSEPFAMVAADLSEGARGAGTGLGVAGVSGEDPSEASRIVADLASDFQRMEISPTVDGFLSWLGPATSSDRMDTGPGSQGPGSVGSGSVGSGSVGSGSVGSGSVGSGSVGSGSVSPGTRGSGVTISTFHRAKGLEWQSVWVAGLEEGLVPIAHARTDDAKAEERRLLYVALTRAARELRCSWARERTFGERSMPRTASPWLAGIGGEGDTDVTPDVTPDDAWRGRLADQRDQLAATRRPGSGRPNAPMVADPAVVDALRAWRARAARAAGVPAHVLLHDATLAAVAALRPATSDELLSVPGLGPVKVARFGTVLLDVMAAHRESA